MFKESRHFFRGLSGDRALENSTRGFFLHLILMIICFMITSTSKVLPKSPGCLHTPLTFIIWPRWLKNSTRASPVMGRTGSFPPMEIPPYLTREQEVLKSGPRTMLVVLHTCRKLSWVLQGSVYFGGIVRTSQQHSSTLQTSYQRLLVASRVSPNLYWVWSLPPSPVSPLSCLPSSSISQPRQITSRAPAGPGCLGISANMGLLASQECLALYEHLACLGSSVMCHLLSEVFPDSTCTPTKGSFLMPLLCLADPLP